MKEKEIIHGLECTISDNNINIIDSWQIEEKSEMREILNEIKEKYPECNTFKRPYDDLTSEWMSHNRLYHFGLWKSHTKDVDLNYQVKWYIQLLYNIIGYTNERRTRH